VEVWGLNGTNAESLLPKDLKDGLNTYKHVAKYMFVVYVIALVATAVELVIGISAMFSRWGSFVTTFFAAVRTSFCSLPMGSMLMVNPRFLSFSPSQPRS
jgi:hypothetical protein